MINRKQLDKVIHSNQDNKQQLYMLLFAVRTGGGVPKKLFSTFQNRSGYIYVVKEHEKRGRNPSFEPLSWYSLPRYGGRQLQSHSSDSSISKFSLGIKSGGRWLQSRNSQINFHEWKNISPGSTLVGKRIQPRARILTH